jgi:oxygen-independent coproporphyrinogen-3 oxidase
MNSASIYLHIPFCVHRCGYCDFNTYSGLENLIPQYVTALCVEIEEVLSHRAVPADVHTIFFGGGTPSLLPAGDIERILQRIDRFCNLADDPEITLEANPGTLSFPYLKDLMSLGINRISLGMQSAHPEELHLLERQHDYSDVIQSFTWARRAGFENVNFDLMFGLPGQRLETWKRSLKLANGLHPDHFSLYALTLEHRTPFGRWAARGLLQMPDPDLAAEMYEWAIDQLQEHGYFHYEISNWAGNKTLSSHGQPNLMVCLHNLQYWRNLPYFGFGAGAHGYVDGFRTANVLSPVAYIHRLMGENGNQIHEGFRLPDPVVASNSSDSIRPNDPTEYVISPATQSVEKIDPDLERAETMFMGLRLVQEGVSTRTFRERFGIELEQAYPQQIPKLISLNLLEWADQEHQALRLTHSGQLLGNQVFLEFV